MLSLKVRVFVCSWLIEIERERVVNISGFQGNIFHLFVCDDSRGQGLCFSLIARLPSGVKYVASSARYPGLSLDDETDETAGCGQRRLRYT